MGFAVTPLGTISTFTSGFGNLFLPQNVPAGSLIICGVCDGSAVASGVGPGDSGSTTYHQIGSFINCNGVLANGFVGVWFGITTVAMTTSDQLNYTTSSLGFAAPTFAMVTGFDPGLYLSGSVGTATGNSANPSASLTPTYAGSLIVGVVGASQRSGSFITVNFGQDAAYASSLTEADCTDGSGNNISSVGGSKVQATIASVIYAPTITSPATAPWAEIIVELPAATTFLDTDITIPFINRRRHNPRNFPII